jgi:hypothetical protein
MDEAVSSSDASKEDACRGIVEESLGAPGEGAGTSQMPADHIMAQDRESSKECPYGHCLRKQPDK